MLLMERVLQQELSTTPRGASSHQDLRGSNMAFPLDEMAFMTVLNALVSLSNFKQRLDLVNAYGQTLLHLAIHLRYRALVRRLIEWGIDLHQKDINGFTALHCAHLCGDWISADYLQRAGATVIALDGLGRSPVQLSSRRLQQTLGSLKQYKCPPTPEQLARFHVPLLIFDAPPFVAPQGDSADIDFHFRCSPLHHSTRGHTPTFFEHHALQQTCNEHRLRTPQAHPTWPSEHAQPRVISQLYEDSGTIISHEICGTFSLSPPASWKVTPQLVEWIRHLDDAGTLDGGTSMDVVAFYGCTTIDGSKVLLLRLRRPSNLLESSIEAQETIQRTNHDRVQTLEYIPPPTDHIPPMLEQEQEGCGSSAPARTG